MTKFIATFVVLVGFVAGGFAQTVEVPQRLLDRAEQSFRETVALRAAVDALEGEIEARKKLEAAQSELIASLKAEIAARDTQLKALAAIKCDESRIYIPGLYFLGPIAKKKRCR
jgi:hypothetical protein